MNKYPGGFVPVNFQMAGKILLIIGVLCVLAKGIDILTGAFNFPSIVLYFGLACLILSAYLILVVPKED